MAEEKPSEPKQEQPKVKVDILRQLTIPLRRELLKVPKYDRTKKAVRATRNFLQKHMKSTDILIGDSLNKELHKGGMKNPPTRVKVKVYKYQDKLMADTINAPFKEAKVEEKKGTAEKVKGLIKKDKPEEKTILTKEQPKEETKKEAIKPKKAAEPKKKEAAAKKK